MPTALIQVDPLRGTPLRAVRLQFNPEKVSRSMQANAAGGGGGEGGATGVRAEPLRLRGPAGETIRFDAMVDILSDPRFESLPESRRRLGVGPQLAALEAMLSPTRAQMIDLNALADRGALEVSPMEAPLTVLVVGPGRVLPVKLTELSIDEEFFDDAMTPIRAKVSISLRVVTVADVGFAHPGATLFLAALAGREALAAAATAEAGANQIMELLA